MKKCRVKSINLKDAGSVDVRKVVGSVVSVYVSYMCTKALWRWLSG